VIRPGYRSAVIRECLFFPLSVIQMRLNRRTYQPAVFLDHEGSSGSLRALCRRWRVSVTVSTFARVGESHYPHLENPPQMAEALASAVEMVLERVRLAADQEGFALDPGE
jgi:hypothetical protein